MSETGIPDSVGRFIDAEVAAATTSYDDLRAVVLNGTLKRSPEPSHTDALLAATLRVLEGVGARLDTIRLVDHVVPPGVQPDKHEHGWERDDFPDLYRSLIEPADIL